VYITYCSCTIDNYSFNYALSNLVHIICFCNTLHQARPKYASAKIMNIMFQSLKSYYFFLIFLLYIADKKFTSSDMRFNFCSVNTTCSLKNTISKSVVIIHVFTQFSTICMTRNEIKEKWDFPTIDFQYWRLP
jgi:hypothetical protein